MPFSLLLSDGRARSSFFSFSFSLPLPDPNASIRFFFDRDHVLAFFFSLTPTMESDHLPLAQHTSAHRFPCVSCVGGFWGPDSFSLMARIFSGGCEMKRSPSFPLFSVCARARRVSKFFFLDYFFSSPRCFFSAFLQSLRAWTPFFGSCWKSRWCCFLFIWHKEQFPFFSPLSFSPWLM